MLLGFCEDYISYIFNTAKNGNWHRVSITYVFVN